MSKLKNKRVFHSMVSVMLVLALLVTGIFAYMTAQDSKTNVFTVGSVKLELLEPSWEESWTELLSPEAVTDTNGVTQLGEDGKPVYEPMTNTGGEAVKGFNNISAGDTFDKDPQIHNIGKNGAYVYLSVSIPTFDVDGDDVKEELFSYVPSTDWTPFMCDFASHDDQHIYYYFYNTVLEPWETTTPLFEQITFIDTDTDILDNSVLEVVVNGYGIQTHLDGSDSSPLNNWQAYIQQEELDVSNAEYDVAVVNYYSESNVLKKTYIGKPDVQFYVEDLFSDQSSWYVYDASNNTEVSPNTEITPIEIASPDGHGGYLDLAELSLKERKADTSPIYFDDGTGATWAKLVPVEGSTGIVERNGVIETYNDPSLMTADMVERCVPVNTTSNDYADTDFSEYYVYGITGCSYYGSNKAYYRNKATVDNLIKTGPDDPTGYFTVAGKGRVDITVNQTYFAEGYSVYSTGASLTVRNADEEIVESFRLVIFGDMNGDCWPSAVDISCVSEILTNNNLCYGTARRNAAHKAANISGNETVDADDNKVLSLIVHYAPFDVNQITGKCFFAGTQAELDSYYNGYEFSEELYNRLSAELVQ